MSTLKGWAVKPRLWTFFSVFAQQPRIRVFKIQVFNSQFLTQMWYFIFQVKPENGHLQSIVLIQISLTFKWAWEMLQKFSKYFAWVIRDSIYSFRKFWGYFEASTYSYYRCFNFKSHFTDFVSHEYALRLCVFSASINSMILEVEILNSNVCNTLRTIWKSVNVKWNSIDYNCFLEIPVNS